MLKKFSPQMIGRAYGIIRTHFSPIKTETPLIHGPCLVLGSAPKPSVPVGFDEAWTFMTVNASQSSVQHWKFSPSFTIMSDQMFGDRPVNLEGKEAVKGRRTGRLILIKRGYPVSETIKKLQALNYRYDELIVIGHWERSHIAHKVLGGYVVIGMGEQKISTGIFAAIMASFLGAAPVILSGFSFSAHGHAYNEFQRKRSHIHIDQAALFIAQKKGLPFYAADAEFSFESGLPEWKG